MKMIKFLVELWDLLEMPIDEQKAFQFLFGVKVQEVAMLREKGYTLKVPLQFSRMLRDGYFGDKDYFESLSDTAAADKIIVELEKWIKMSILYDADSERFSSDRTIQVYAERTWKIDPCQYPF
ncbi:alpha-glucan phosphorylase, H isozyme-like [Vicia villosa]|uniref:alpha-glucan phosphorylase, H isozyme-like n=1 Tax=Vicia villosa TaxID=3911 RepID=UPI00273CBE21|nr:alpha-glucan phosphorylase, H isozyme-like [Vicia villosa]XP_058722512.1 alpha-glucan phosphorylase, H isozyme-like [Vicia villosa]